MDNISEHLKWVNKHKKFLTISSGITGLIGLVCAYFINPYSWIGLILMGIISFFYIFPIIPFYKKSPTLRELPYLKIILIAIVWSLTIVWLPHIDSNFNILNHNSSNFVMALIQNALFVIAITIPFDIRDLEYDQSTQLKTFPQLLGIKGSLGLSMILLAGSATITLYLPIILIYKTPIIISIAITALLILLTKKNRNDLFYSGLIEGTVLIVYACVLITHYFFFPETPCIF